MRKTLEILCKLSNILTKGLDACIPVIALAIRLYIAKIFFWSGWLKITSWSSTLYLFQNEYKIIGISPIVAAYLGAAAELGLPIFFVLGLGARIPAVTLFIFNIFTVVFYPDLLKPEFIGALKETIIWGVLIGVIVFYGHGKISIDYLLQKKLCKEYKF